MLLRLQNSAAAMTGMVHEQERTANNLANAGTVGFKRDRTFVELLGEELDVEGGPRSRKTQVSFVDFAQGDLEKTGNPLDVALQGNGFFVVQDSESGESAYTRAGRFHIGDDGSLRTQEGHTVEGTGGPIQIPPDATRFTVGPDGSIRADEQEIGRLRVVTFESPAQLLRTAGTLFNAAGQEPLDESTAQIVQGHVETSNVDAIHEMTGMIEHLRLFEMQQRALKAADDGLEKSVRSLGRF